MRHHLLKSCAALTLIVAAAAASPLAQQKDTSAKKAAAAALPERIWQDLGDISALNLTYGAGGKAHAPDPNGTFTFVEEDLAETSPKFVVTDAQGVRWKVKLG